MVLISHSIRVVGMPKGSVDTIEIKSSVERSTVEADSRTFAKRRNTSSAASTNGTNVPSGAKRWSYAVVSCH